jgi:hypothetical protein
MRQDMERVTPMIDGGVNSSQLRVHAPLPR